MGSAFEADFIGHFGDGKFRAFEELAGAAEAIATQEGYHGFAREGLEFAKEWERLIPSTST